VKWYTKAAEQGHAPAQNKVGCIHHDKEQYDEAFKWYMKAANQGFTDAEINLGIYYEDGLGVEKNIPEAIKWYAKAAEKGDTYAAEVLEELTSRE
jgi:TPR repeat protein